MLLFIYEFITGGGLWSRPEWGKPSGSLLAEGRAMLAAIASDFSQLDDTDVVVMQDTRVDLPAIPSVQLRPVGSDDAATERFAELTTNADATLIIAPEIDNELGKCCELVEQLGGNLLGTEPEFVRLTSDKHATAMHLAKANVAVPQSFLVTEKEHINLPGPYIVKPRFGAGSGGVRLIQSLTDLSHAEHNQQHCVQTFASGRSASVAVIRGPKGRVILPPCWQMLLPDSFDYAGGALISETPKIARAKHLAELVTQAFPNARGYFGIDLILGPCDDGSEDVVIEVNPRLTTSYVGLRAALRINLSDILLRTMAGEIPSLPAANLTTHFDAAGNLISC